MKVSADYVCGHGMPSPWATCTECMMLPGSERPEPPPPPPKTRVKKARPGAMPKTLGEPLPDLVGDRDVSYPVHDFDAHIEGEGNEWLFGDQGFPWGLRRGGWIYLRSDGVLGARVHVKGIGFREVRKRHTGDDEDMGPGPTIEVEASTWERVRWPLGELAESQRQGYRYLITKADGEPIHLMADEEIPPATPIDPAASE